MSNAKKVPTENGTRNIINVNGHNYLAMKFLNLRVFIMCLIAHTQDLKAFLVKVTEDKVYLDLMNDSFKTKHGGKILFTPEWARSFNERLTDLPFEKSVIDGEVKNFLKRNNNSVFEIDSPVTIALVLDPEKKNIKIGDFNLPIDDYFEGATPDESHIAELNELLNMDDSQSAETQAPEQKAPATSDKAVTTNVNPIPNPEEAEINLKKIQEKFLPSVKKGMNSRNVEFSSFCTELDYLWESRLNEIKIEGNTPEVSLTQDEKASAATVAAALGQKAEDIEEQMLAKKRENLPPAEDVDLEKVSVSKGIWYLYHIMLYTHNLVVTDYASTIVTENVEA